MYQVARPSRCEFVPVRTLDYHVRLWGNASASTRPPLLLAHGWMDVGASYQFVVDALSQAFCDNRLIIAPDWRGFGLTAPPARTDHYHFADYLADLEYLLDHYAPGQTVDLVGHSMGGNIAMMYAGVRPQRVRRLVNLEGFGLPATEPSQAAQRYGQWIDDIRRLERGDIALKGYDSLDAVAQRLIKTNPRLPLDKATWLAQHWSRPNAQGQWQILGDPAHKIPSPQLYRVDEVLAVHSAISAPTLTVEAREDSMVQWWKGKYDLDEYHERLKVVPNYRTVVLDGAGHMLHHDQPQAVATLIEDFLAEADPA
ncbi:MAG: alpha/beta hydrolase [Burkholderiaceae bacterium]|nr:alpha/beta hydrolase [Burkholderiaceae bacterium]